MGFKLKNILKNPIINPLGLGSGGPIKGGIVGGVTGLFKKGQESGGGGQIYGDRDLNTFGTPLDVPQTAVKRMSLSDVLGEVNKNYRPVNQSAIYNEALAAGEAARTREENRAMENVLSGLQSRGLTRSGITLKDVTEKVIGPSTERARQLASDIALKQAQDQIALESERQHGGLQAILGEQGFGGQFDLSNLSPLQRTELQKLLGAQGLQDLEAQYTYGQKAESEARKAKRKGLLGDLLLGGISGFAGGAGQSLGKA